MSVTLSRSDADRTPMRLVAVAAALAAGVFYLYVTLISAEFLVLPSPGLIALTGWFSANGHPFWTLAVSVLSLGLSVPGVLLLWHAVRTFRGLIGVADAAGALIAVGLLSSLAYILSLTAPEPDPQIGIGTAGFLLPGLVLALPAFISLTLAVVLRRRNDGQSQIGY